MQMMDLQMLELEEIANMKKTLTPLIVILIFIVIIVIVGNFVFSFYFREKSKKVEEKIEIKEEYAEWFNSTAKEYEFNDPYVKCIFDKTCNGSFDIVLYSNLNNSIEKINDTLKEFGKIKDIGILNNYSILLNVKELKVINNFIDSSIFYDIHLSNVYSDYKINISEEDLVYCENDSECARVNNNCCASSNCGYKSINRKYKEIWATQFYSCRFIGCLAMVCFFNKLPACENNQCIFMDFKNCSRDNDCILSKEKGCINKNVFNRFYYTYSNDLNCECENYECLEKEKSEENKIDEGNLIVDIAQPINNSNITTTFVNTNVITNKKAVCFYFASVSFPNSKKETSLKQMNITNGTFHSQSIENLEDNGLYIITLKCLDEFGNSQNNSIKFKTNILFPDIKNLTKRWFIGDERGDTLYSGMDLPNLFKSGEFYSGEGIYVQFISILRINIKIENSTSNGDLESPQVLIEVDTNYTNPLFHYELMFSKAVNFSNMPNGEYINIFKKYYKTQTGSTNDKIILHEWDTNKEIILEDNQSIKVNGEEVIGTHVDIDNKWGDVTRIFIDMTMPNPNKDYILAGEYYDDYVFNSLRLNFKLYSNESGAEIYIESVK